MRIDANLNDVQERGPLPGGMYSYRINGAPKLEKSKTSAKDMLVFNVDIINLDSEVKSSCFTNMKYYVVKSDTDGWKVWGLKQIAKASGIEFTDDGLDTDDFAGAEGECVVERELYQGKEKATISSFVVSGE